MNISVILKPAPHCPIPRGHPLYNGYEPADETDIRRRFARASDQYGDDYDRVMREDWLSAPGGFK